MTPRLSPGQRLWQIAWLALLLVPLALAATYVWNKHQWAQQRLAELEPRHARLQGLLARQADYAAANDALQAYLASHVYPAEQTATEAGNDAQQRVRNLFAESGLSVVSLQVQAVKEEGAFDHIPLALRAEGSLSALQDALAKLQVQRPTVLVNSLSLQTVGAARPGAAPQLSAQLSLTVLRARP